MTWDPGRTTASIHIVRVRMPTTWAVRPSEPERPSLYLRARSFDLEAAARLLATSAQSAASGLQLASTRSNQGQVDAAASVKPATPRKGRRRAT